MRQLWQLSVFPLIFYNLELIPKIINHAFSKITMQFYYSLYKTL